MTGFDIALIVVLLGFALLGLKHGSIWIVSCLVGGFAGAFLVEYYQLQVASMMGDFVGAKTLAAIVLFLIGLLVSLIPGWILSRIAGLFCMGAFDKILGVLAGLLAGLIAVTLAFMIALPRLPAMERGPSWRTSKYARPLCERLENFFGHSSRRRATVADQIQHDVAGAVTPIVDKTTSSLKHATQNVERTVTKKAEAAGHTVSVKAKEAGRTVAEKTEQVGHTVAKRTKAVGRAIAGDK
jgi:uncharacterized membrane protein required for colicin V production